MALAKRLERRQAAFLERIRLDILPHPSNPYAQLLRHAGCTFGDIQNETHQHGIEATLQKLLQAGVYLTVDEFKGRCPARRGNLEIPVQPHMLQSPRASGHLPGQSGGTRSRGTPVMTDFAFIRACAANAAVMLGARDGLNWRKSVWESPGAGLRFRAVKLAGFGVPPAANFSLIDPSSGDIPPYYMWNLRLISWISRMAGRPLPWPIYAPVSDPSSLAAWLQDVHRSGEIPYVQTFPGSAVMLARWAVENGYDISGTWMTISGEPITDARVATIEAAGCHVIARYGTMEAGAIGYSCANRQHADDLHLLTDMHAMIHAAEAGQAIGLPAKALMMTSLHPRSPFTMLNLSMGDQAEMGERNCGCALEAAGWSRHIWNIRSFEKLNSGSVTFIGTEIIPVLEEVLPARFGGTPTDYQLAEIEQADGEPIVELIVHPRLGKLDESAIAEQFMESLGQGSPAVNIAFDRWRDAGTLRVVRREPRMTKAGKINYLHV